MQLEMNSKSIARRWSIRVAWLALAVGCNIIGCKDNDHISAPVRSVEGVNGFVADDAGASGGTEVCGDGVVSGIEQCDPPSPGHCSDYCDLIGSEICGDAARRGAEECDDGNSESLDGCSGACRIEACGNGRVDPGETCDRSDATCSASCWTLASGSPGCGNATLEPNEECDDGNSQSGDGCSAGCLRESCGNARLDQGPSVLGAPSQEACDPPEVGYCDADCQLMACGDGRQASTEGCDDGNTTSLDGCSSSCVSEVCGDGLVNQSPGQEQCEPAGTDVCDMSCRRIECGNGAPAQAGEQCDDGNRVGGDGCDTECRSERCGNDRLDANEDCEPPSSERCDASCRSVRVECGDTFKQAGEECDDGNAAFGDGCSPTCLLERCGNGRIESPRESCEPPGTPGCGIRCRRPICGDGVLDDLAGEACEDGNLDAGDGCSPTCRFEVCGNGVLDLGEQCDPPGSAECGSGCLITIQGSGGPLGSSLPAGASSFQLNNPSFERSLEPWVLTRVAPAIVQFSPVDVRSAPSSGSAHLSTYQQETVTSGNLRSTAVVDLAASAQARRANLSQCVRTQAGASYHLSVSAFVPGYEVTPVSLGLGARFYPGSDCAGTMLSGVRGSSVLRGGEQWVVSRLPPQSPVASNESTFDTPDGASSMRIWIELSQEPLDTPSSVLVDRVELVRTTAAPRCGDGIPESPEECEPSVTPGCSSSCQLPVVCGDGLGAPAECAAGSCPQDCGLRPQVCGDGVVAAPEECEPPGLGTCRANCTRHRTECGDGRVEGQETCDPPNGASCSLDCRSIQCGNGVVEAPEDCEPPLTRDCSRHCRSFENQAATCGDGLLQGDEQCDPPNPDTWCSSSCKRRSPTLACGDGVVDRDLGEQCDPPGFDADCAADCRRPVCGDGQVGGGELCDPPDGEACGADCQLLGEVLGCQACLAETCSGPSAEDDLFSACFGLDGVALAGPAKNAPLRQLCAGAVECMRQTGCAAETLGAARPNPAACYCGKSVLTGAPLSTNRLRACRDGVAPADGPCRVAFERAAESVLPSLVLAALDTQFSNAALSAAVELMTECGHTSDGCEEACSATSECGNGVVEPGELCDPLLDRRCAPVCAILPCGNGVVDVTWPDGYAKPEGWYPESCDVLDPYTKEYCDNTCHLIVTCGDGDINPSVEACDPGRPQADWSECCQPDSVGYDNSRQLLGCDRDGSGKIDKDEQCQVPSICGNGRREGIEECDDPLSPATCSSDCKAVDACTECTRTQCASAHRGCFEAAEPSIRAGCGQVLECINASQCAKDDAYQVCLCGSVPFGPCLQTGGNGACEDVFTRNLPRCIDGAGNVDLACVQQDIKNPVYPTGAAAQVVDCRQHFCATECNYWAYPTAPIDE